MNLEQQTTVSGFVLLPAGVPHEQHRRPKANGVAALLDQYG